MRKWLKDLDGLLRGELTTLAALRGGQIELPARRLAVVLIVLGCLYGMCMGSYALFQGKGSAGWQFLAATLKVPALFLLTLCVTFPSLYVFNALVGSRLNLPSVWRLLVAALAVNLTVLASLGPIVAFFAASTISYPFMVLLNVAVFAVAGVLGFLFLLQTLHRLTVAREETPPALPSAAAQVQTTPPSAPSAGGDKTGALDKLDGRVLGAHEKLVFRCWLVVFALVGSQMGWVLRPFLGQPSQEFTWLRPRGSSFFEAVWQHFLSLFQ